MENCNDPIGNRTGDLTFGAVPQPTTPRYTPEMSKNVRRIGGLSAQETHAGWKQVQARPVAYYVSTNKTLASPTPGSIAEGTD